MLDEVRDVLRDDGATLALAHREDVCICQRPQLRPLGHGHDVMAASAQPFGHDGRIHLVEQEPQPSASFMRSQA